MISTSAGVIARKVDRLRIWDWIWDWIFPPSCILCRKSSHNGPSIFLCQNCAIGLFPILEPMCPRCGLPHAFSEGEPHLCGNCLKRKAFFDRARAAFYYESSGRELVIKFKFNKGFYLAPDLIRMAHDRITTQLNREDLDLIVPVPLHPKRLRNREYNQSLLLAREIKKILRLPILISALIRQRWTTPQTQLPMSQRARNVKNAFLVKRPEMVADKRVLLVDDVFTSGSTVDECARKLKQAGASRVEVFTLTRVV
jgi:ComF family protein